MANKRLPMRKIREVLRLSHACGLGEREIARSCRIARATVGNYLKRAEAVGLTWPAAAELSETELASVLFPRDSPAASRERAAPDCQYIYDQLRQYRKLNLTLTQLWLEYKESHPDGYQYTQFCEHYRRWRGELDYCMRQEHRAGGRGSPPLQETRTWKVGCGWWRLQTRLRAGHVPPLQIRHHRQIHAGGRVRKFRVASNEQQLRGHRSQIVSTQAVNDVPKLHRAGEHGSPRPAADGPSKYGDTMHPVGPEQSDDGVPVFPIHRGTVRPVHCYLPCMKAEVSYLPRALRTFCSDCAVACAAPRVAASRRYFLISMNFPTPSMTVRGTLESLRRYVYTSLPNASPISL